MIGKIESGQVDLPQSKIKKIADVFNTTPLELMGYSPDTSITGLGIFSKLDEKQVHRDAICQQEISRIEQLNDRGKTLLFNYLRFLLQDEENLKQ